MNFGYTATPGVASYPNVTEPAIGPTDISGFPRSTEQSFGATIEGSRGNSITKQVHIVWDITAQDRESKTKKPFYDTDPVQGEFMFGRDKVEELNVAKVGVAQERTDPYVPVMEARGAFAWNAWLQKHPFDSLAAAWSWGMSLKYLGVLTAFSPADSMATITTSRKAFDVINHWSPDLLSHMCAWFHLEVRRENGRYKLRLQPYCIRERGPIPCVLDDVLDVPIMTYKVGNALVNDEISLNRMDALEDIDKYNGMPTKMLKDNHNKESDVWETDFDAQTYHNRLEAKSRIKQFLVGGSIYMGRT